MPSYVYPILYTLHCSRPRVSLSLPNRASFSLYLFRIKPGKVKLKVVKTPPALPPSASPPSPYHYCFFLLLLLLFSVLLPVFCFRKRQPAYLYPKVLLWIAHGSEKPQERTHFYKKTTYCGKNKTNSSIYFYLAFPSNKVFTEGWRFLIYVNIYIRVCHFRETIIVFFFFFFMVSNNFLVNMKIQILKTILVFDFNFKII